MSPKFGNNKENTDNHDTEDEEWGIWNSPLELIKKTKSEDNSDDDNAHLTQTQVKYDGIFVFYLNRNLVLHVQILPQICKKSKDYIIFSCQKLSFSMILSSTRVVVSVSSS